MADDHRTRNAPVLPIEYPCEPGELIWPCHDCLPWHVEIYYDAGDGDALWVREWHAVGCPIFEETEPSPKSGN